MVVYCAFSVRWIYCTFLDNFGFISVGFVLLLMFVLEIKKDCWLVSAFEMLPAGIHDCILFLDFWRSKKLGAFGDEDCLVFIEPDQ